MSTTVLVTVLLLVIARELQDCVASQMDDEVPLTLAVLLSGIDPETNDYFSGTLDGRPFLASIDLAVELINNRSDILHGYHLRYVANDTQVSR